jgi:hypothetical protein
LLDHIKPALAGFLLKKSPQGGGLKGFTTGSTDQVLPVSWGQTQYKKSPLACLWQPCL